MKKLLVILVFTTITSFVFGQKKPAYMLYKTNGKKLTYKKMMKQLEAADVILFGEIHNNPIAHWLQLEVTQDLAAKKNLILGAEMFEADNQRALSDYLSQKIDRKGLDSLARLWSNYDTDYAPLVELAKEQKLNFVATNIPRRYARKVFREGLESLAALSEEEKAGIAPLPIAYDGELPGYKKMLEMMGDSPAHTGDNFPKAQAIKDATMAHFIAQNSQNNHTFIHYNGSYHSDNYEGILWYLKRLKPNLTYVTISTVLQKDIGSLDKENQKADVVICVVENMTTTY